jgi:hypothetical protein
MGGEDDAIVGIAGKRLKEVELERCMEVQFRLIDQKEARTRMRTLTGTTIKCASPAPCSASR